VRVNVVANLVAAAIIYVGGVALGAFPPIIALLAASMAILGAFIWTGVVIGVSAPSFASAGFSGSECLQEAS
jgi:hypothetical protein